MNGRPCGASIHFRGKMLIPPDVHAAGRDFIGFVRAAREFCRRLFIFGAGLYVSGIARLRGSRACSADGQQDCRCAVRRVGDVGAVVVARGLAAVPHRYGGALCALDLAGGGLAAGAASRWNVAVGALPASLFPLNNSVFAPSQKHLMHLECIKRACNIRLNAAHVRRKIGWLLPVLCTSFVNIFKTLLLHVALLPEKW